MRITVVTPPAQNPVALDDAKKQLRVDFNDDDALIESMTKAATGICEGYQGRAYITRTLRRTLDNFQSLSNGILLPYPPLITVVSVKYDDIDGAEQTLAADQYQFDPSEVPARVRLAPAVGMWPSTQQGKVGAVRVEYTAGYGDQPEQIPADIAQAIKIKLSDLYENRESIAPGTMTELASVAAENLLFPDLVQWQVD